MQQWIIIIIIIDKFVSAGDLLNFIQTNTISIIESIWFNLVFTLFGMKLLIVNHFKIQSLVFNKR